MNPSLRKEPTRIAVQASEFLAEVARASRPETALHEMADGFVDRLGARAAFVYRTQADRDSLELVASRGRQPEPWQGADVPPPGWPPLAHATRTGELQLSSVPQPANSQFGPRSITEGAMTVVVPLCCAGRVLGAIAANFAGVLSPGDCRTLASVGDVLGGLLGGVSLRTGSPTTASQRVAELEARARYRDEWTHTLAYELRLLLINIVLLAGQLARPRVDTDSAASMRHLLDNADRFSDLVRRLLEVSRGPHSALMLERRRGDFVAFVRHFVEQRRWTGLVRVRSRTELPEIEFDAQRISDVLVNLTANAQRRSPEGLIDLVIECTGGEIEIAVMQGTPGGPPPSDPMVEVFFGASGLSDDGAANVGMDICRALIEAHGGRLWVEATKSARSVRFSLPVSSD